MLMLETLRNLVHILDLVLFGLYWTCFQISALYAYKYLDSP